MNSELLVVFIIFIAFIVITYRVFKWLAKAFLIGFIALLFPVIANHVFGLNVDTSVHSMLWYAAAGVGLFFIFTILKTGWKIIKILTYPFRKIIGLLFRGKGRGD